ncbi:MAG: hypothetical protein ACMZ7B_10875 [Balneola sp.]
MGWASPIVPEPKAVQTKSPSADGNKQMRQYPFFSRIGAFSINLENPRSSIKSLRYAVDSMERENSCLFIYPEGKLTSISDSKPVFKEGLSWLCQKMEQVDFVPVAFYIDHSKSNKPDLYISIGEVVNRDSLMEKHKLNSVFEESTYKLLANIKSGLPDSTIKD